MSSLWFVRLLVVGLGLILVSFDLWMSHRTESNSSYAERGLIIATLVSVLVVTYIVIRQFTFPLHLDLMEGAVLQHFIRASDYEAIYPLPGPDFVPLAYNPGYYVIAMPFGWILGVNLLTLRLVSLFGLIGSAVMVALILRRETQSWWWGLVGVGLFAAGYSAMDAYLNTAHSDSWFLFATLLGSYVISLDHSYRWNLAGVVILVVAFWCKQHGALFVIGGVVYLSWREIVASEWSDGITRAIPYWLIAAVLGPGVYLMLGNAIFGPDFHYFTWEVPRGWSEFGLSTLVRVGKFMLGNYAVLATVSGLVILWTVIRHLKSTTIWHIQVVVAGCTAVMGALDAASSNNVFIPMGIFFIIVGVLGLHTLDSQVFVAKQYKVAVLGLVVSFALFIYDPQPFIPATDADEVYDDFVGVLNKLEGTIYAPWQAYLADDVTLYPSSHWVGIDDMIRGPNLDTHDNPNTRQQLESVISPEGSAYFLTNQPLEEWPMFTFFLDYYVLQEDFGNRFRVLGPMPKRFDHGYPRYLYRFDPENAPGDPEPCCRLITPPGV